LYACIRNKVSLPNIFIDFCFVQIPYEMPVIILKQTFKMKLKLFISWLENADISLSSYLKKQIECSADNGNLRKYTKNQVIARLI